MNNSIVNKLKSNKAKISVTGLGYVGLPLAQAFAKKFSVIAYDHNSSRINLLKHNIDPSKEIQCNEFENLDITYTDNEQDLDNSIFHIIAVPTPIDKYNKPDLSLLINATKTIARHIKEGDIVVYESTVYPGCTEDDCLPILEKISNLKVDTNFGLGYSPERINPGDAKHRLSSVVKVVAGHDKNTCDTIAEVYSSIIEAGIHIAPSIKVAEAAKIIENTQRDVNIALMNELSIIFARMNIDTRDVISAASTKWNFIPFMPGLVGGHCISVDPYYLDYKANELGYHTQIISRGRFINDNMGKYIANVTVKKIINKGFEITKSKILILGFTYKENVSDIRNTRSLDIYNELKEFCVSTIDIVDYFASVEDTQKQYGLNISHQVNGSYDAIIIAVAHKDYTKLNEQFFKQHLNKDGVVCDIKGILNRDLFNIDIWRL